MLKFDHFYFALPDEAFDEAVRWFKQFPQTQHYSVQSSSGDWEGLYPFTREGAFPEFLRATERNKVGTLGLAFSAVGISDLHSKLLQAHPDFAWQRYERLKADGSEYYISSEPKQQGERIFYWVLDWQGSYIEKRKTWGTDSSNPLIRAEAAELHLSAKELAILSQHSAWIGNRQTMPKSEIITFEQYGGGVFELKTTESKDFGFSLRLAIDGIGVVTKELKHFSLKTTSTGIEFTYPNSN